MKRIYLSLVAALLSAATAMAEGYQINTLSARQLGMAHTGTALKLGTESQFFNPAGMAFMERRLDVAASMAGVIPTATATVDGRKWTTDNDVSTPMMVSASFAIYPTLKAGVAFYTPYGSSINWTRNWPGSVLNQKVSLKVFTLQPTFAWRPLPTLSIGAGLTLSWGSVNLDKGLVSASTLDAMLASQGVPSEMLFGNTSPASINLQGTTTVRCGVNLGAMWDIRPDLTVGVSWRSTSQMRVKAGDATVTYANEMAANALQTLKVLNEANFQAQMPCPWVLSMGVAYKPIKPLTLTLDARLTGWHAYSQLDIEFLAEQLTPFNQHITKDYHNSWTVAVGAQYALTERFDVRCGLMYDMSPINKRHYNPETPGMGRLAPSVGLSFRPVDRLSIDLGFMYVAGLGVDGASCEYDDLLAKSMGLPYERTFEADYSLHAFIPALGLAFQF